ncbi:hypothetical protein KFK09_026080 [Dendrobium nobile]|uniref:Uncharacterized protein n=1 Tax=Dendrobium nobile TaxID=94219 RepID=A0A8T3A6Y3_DENNO|nr:hypothetical protein KFK09_026080 [Dendrobium nobile]
MSSLPEPSLETISLRKVGGIAAALKFSGRPTEDVVRQKEKELRSALIQAGLNPIRGCVLARYNDPGRTWSFIMRPDGRTIRLSTGYPTVTIGIQRYRAGYPPN